MLSRPTRVFLPAAMRRERVTVGIDFHKLAIRHHAVEPVIEFTALVTVEAQFAHELFESGSALGLAFDFLQDRGIGEHGSEQAL